MRWLIVTKLSGIITKKIPFLLHSVYVDLLVLIPLAFARLQMNEWTLLSVPHRNDFSFIFKLFKLSTFEQTTIQKMEIFLIFYILHFMTKGKVSVNKMDLFWFDFRYHTIWNEILNSIQRRKTEKSFYDTTKSLRGYFELKINQKLVWKWIFAFSYFSQRKLGFKLDEIFFIDCFKS